MRLNVAMAAMAGLALISAGCDKKLQLHFVNTTPQTLTVDVTSPGGWMERAGMVAPHGRLRHDVKIEEDDLPATMSWRAGEFGGSFTVTKDTPKKQFIYIQPGQSIGPVDQNTEIRQHRQVEIRDLPVMQYEVVQ